MDCPEDPKRQNDSVKRPADKGGAVVVWARHLYLAEVERQLSDTNFYQQQDRDFTIQNDNRVRRVVKEATSQHELLDSAINISL